MTIRSGIVLMAVMCCMAAQAQEADSLVVQNDTTTIDTVAPAQPAKQLKPLVKRHKDGTRVYPDSAIYQGIDLKLDLANTIIEAAVSKGKILSFEMAMNVRLKQRYFPTFEAGYARADTEADGGHHNGEGGFFRVGLDINPLKKHPERPSCLLVGVRVGTALQHFDLTNVTYNTSYWGVVRKDFTDQFGADCWGEIVAGVQVQIWEGLQMGWYARMKILFTRTVSDGKVMPYYIPGFGYRDESNWGFNYYIGYKF